MGKATGAPEYSLRLKQNMTEFIKDFNSEFKNQEKKENKASERRMRVLLRQFYDRVYRPYKEESLGHKTIGLEDILQEGEL